MEGTTTQGPFVRVATCDEEFGSFLDSLMFRNKENQIVLPEPDPRFVKYMEGAQIRNETNAEEERELSQVYETMGRDYPPIPPRDAPLKRKAEKDVERVTSEEKDYEPPNATYEKMEIDEDF